MTKLIDMTGQKFGRLTVIKRVHSSDKYSKTMWLCRCECGTERSVRGNSLRKGLTKSCGCLQKRFITELGKKNKITLGLANMRTVIKLYKIRAKRRGLEYNLTEEQFANITKKNCFYCGVKPENIVDKKSLNGAFIYNGLDRVDNLKGYTMDNIVPCCKHCNMAKNTFTSEEFKNWVRRIYNNIFTGDE